MGLFNLSRFRVTFFSASALAASFVFPALTHAAAPDLTLIKSATGSGIFSLNNQSVDHPTGTTVTSPSNKSNVLYSSNRFQQGVTSKIEITTPSGPVVTDIRGSVYTPKSAAISALKGLGRVAGWAGAAMLAVDGYNAMLDGLGWYIDHDQVWTKYGDPLQVYPEYPPSGDYRAYSFSQYSGGTYYTSPSAACAVSTPVPPPNAVTYLGVYSIPSGGYATLVANCVSEWIDIYGGISQAVSHVYEHNRYAPDGSPSACYGDIPLIDGVCTSPELHKPASVDLIESLVDEMYTPMVNDYSELIDLPEFTPDLLYIEDISSIELPAVVTSSYDALTGDQVVNSTGYRYDFNVDRSVANKPSVSMNEVAETSTYTNGVKTSGSTSTTSRPAASSSNLPVSTPQPDPVTGSGSGSGFELPSFCSWAPVVCDFIDWFQDGDAGEDPDLSSIMKNDEEFAKTEIISFGAAVCPAPHTIHISALSMSVDLSFDFFCQFAEYAKALVLAAAYIFAAYITLGVARG